MCSSSVFAVFSSLLIIKRRWQVDVTVTLRQAYVKFFENERAADGQADFSLFLYSLSILLLCVLMFAV